MNKNTAFIPIDQCHSLEQLDNLTGKGPVKQIFHRLCFMKETHPECRITPPSAFVLKMQSGEGFSKMAKIITDILFEYHLFEFRSKERLVEYTFTKEADNMLLLKEKVRWSTVISNDFYGVQAWDVNIPIRQLNESMDQEIGQYIKDNEGRVCFLIRVYSENQMDIDRLVAAIGKYSNCYYLDIPGLTPKELQNIIMEWAEADGFTMDDNAQDVLLELVNLNKKREYYSGLKTLRRTLDALELYLAITWNQNVITREHVKEYISKCLVADMKREMCNEKRMGF